MKSRPAGVRTTGPASPEHLHRYPPFPLLPPGCRCGRCLATRAAPAPGPGTVSVRATDTDSPARGRSLVTARLTLPALSRSSGDRTEQRGISVGTGTSGRRRQEATPRLLAWAHAVNTGPFCCPSSATSPAVLCFLLVTPRLDTAPLPAPPPLPRAAQVPPEAEMCPRRRPRVRWAPSGREVR